MKKENIFLAAAIACVLVFITYQLAPKINDGQVVRSTPQEKSLISDDSKMNIGEAVQSVPQKMNEISGETKTTEKYDNFLLGHCLVRSEEEALTKCEQRLPVMPVQAWHYTENELVINVIYGENVKDFTKDEEFIIPISYEINGDGILATVIGYGGCISKTLFYKKDKRIYEKSISQSGTCGEAQRRAHELNKNKTKEIFIAS